MSLQPPRLNARSCAALATAGRPGTSGGGGCGDGDGSGRATKLVGRRYCPTIPTSEQTTSQAAPIRERPCL